MAQLDQKVSNDLVKELKDISPIIVIMIVRYTNVHLAIIIKSAASIARLKAKSVSASGVTQKMHCPPAMVLVAER